MKEKRISNLNEILASKESLVEKMSDDCVTLNQRLEEMGSEKKKYLSKIETILSEQKVLRSKD